MSIFKRLFFYFIFLAIFCVLGLVSEGILRVAMPELRSAYHAPIDPETGVGYTMGHPFSYNKWGMREVEFPVKKPEGQIRILALGDSITFGYGLPYEMAWPKLLESRLAETYEDKNIFCINTAGVGATTHQQMDFYKKLGRQFGASVVIVGFTTNDVRLKHVMRDVKEVGLGGTISKSVKWRYQLRRSYLFSLIDLAFTEGVKRYVLPAFGKDWISAYPYLLSSLGATSFSEQAWKDTLDSVKLLKEMTDEDGVKLVIAAFPYQFQISDDPRDNPYKVDKDQFTIDPINKLKKFSEKEGIYFVDLQAPFTDLRAEMLEEKREWNPLFVDFAHPNEMGQKLAASVIFESLAKLDIFK